MENGNAPDQLPYRALLGIELRTIRKANGWSLRTMARKLGLRAHSNISEYEKGLRIPPNDILISYERLFPECSDKLVSLRRMALLQEAHRERDADLQEVRTKAASPNLAHHTEDEVRPADGSEAAL